MAIIRWSRGSDVFRPLQEMEREMDRMRTDMDRIFYDFGMRSRSAQMGVFPPLNVTEDETAIYVHAELPGVLPEDMDISIEGDTLTLRGIRKAHQTAEKDISYHRREREYGKFRRSVTLPVSVDLDGVSASNRHGVLSIVLPKAKAVLPKKIEVIAEE